MNLIRNRLPSRSEIISVFGVVVFACHSWTMLGFLNKLSSFLLYFNIGEILSVFAYMMSVALLESIAVTILLVLLSVVLPSNWLRDGFAYKGFVIVATATAASILFQKFLPDDYPSTLMLAVSTLAPLVLIVVLIGVSQAFPRLRSLLLDIQDRISIMSYIYDPVIHVPLMVLSPGPTTWQDVHTLTSSVDLLPTIAHLTGNPIPNWAEGRLLPNLGGEADEGRSVFSMDAKFNSSFGPLTNYVMSITRDRQRLTYYCYPKDGYQQYEFYDLDADPLEMKDLFSSPPTLAHEMKDELLQKIEEFNRPYRRGGE